MNTPLRIVALGGLGEIGMNCLLLETAKEILVIDCGLMFSELENFGVQFVIPNFSYLIEKKEKVTAFLMTHGHEDHIGALPFAIKAGVRAPVYCTPFTAALVKQRLAEDGLDDRVDLREFKIGEKISFTEMAVTPHLVNHSIVDAVALFVDTPLGKVIHTGDFKIDPEPFLGGMMDLSPFQQAGDDGVYLLMSDSTNVERDELSTTETEVFQSLEKLFNRVNGMLVVSMFASNVARMAQVLQLAEKMGRKVALAGRSMDQNLHHALELGHLKAPQSLLVSIDDVSKFRRDEVLVLSGGCQGEFASSLNRIAWGEHKQVKLQQGDVVVLSSKQIPGNEKPISRMINQLFRQGADVIYEGIEMVHASGHATRPELARILKATKPRYFIPVHGEYRHLIHHARLAHECGVGEKNVLVAGNGDIIEAFAEGLEIVDHLEETRVLVEDRQGADVSKALVKERKQMGETGVVFALVVRSSEHHQTLSEPDLMSRGLINESMEAWIMDDARNVLKKVISDYEQGIIRGDYSQDLHEAIRIELRRYFKNAIGKKPVVMPIILDV